MRLSPRTPPDEANLPATKPLVEVSHLLLLGGVVLVVVIGIVGFIVDRAADWVSPETEREVFDPLMPMFLSEVGVADPEAIPMGLQALLDRAAAAAPPTGFPLRAHLSCSPAPNALALPGGHIVVTAGLLDLLEHENSLVFVLGHEIGHLVHRDQLRGLGRGVTLGLLLQGVLSLGGGGGGDIATKATEAALRSHSRKQELEADQVGAEVVASLYGHLGGVAEVHAALGEISDEGWADRLDWSRTHPVSSKRQEQILHLMQEHAWTIEGALQPLDDDLAADCAPPSVDADEGP